MDDMRIVDEDDDLLTKKLKYLKYEKEGKLYHEVANQYAEREQERFFLKGHKKAITALEWMPDDKSVMTSSKDCCLIRWDLESESKLIFKGQKHQDRNLSGHFDEPLAMAIS